MPRRSASLTGSLPRSALFALGLALGCEGAPNLAPPSAQHAVRSEPPSEFAVEGVSLSDSESSLTIGRLIGRKRTGGAGLFTYHDLRELVLTNTELVITSSSPSLSIEPLLDYVRTLSSVIGQKQPSDEGGPEPITRLVFENLTIRMRHPTLPEFGLSADKARLNFDSNMLVLEEGAKLSPPRGKRLAAPVAVLAEHEAGVYFPRGYWVDAPKQQDCKISVVLSPRSGEVEHFGRVCGGPALQASAFFTMDPSGSLSPARVVPAIDYEDPVAKRERIALAQFIDRAPNEWKPLLLMMMASPDVPIRLQGVDWGGPLPLR